MSSEVHFGPSAFPGNGSGTIKQQEIRLILEHTGCKARVRHSEPKKLFIHGPAVSIDRAKAMAEAFILASQQSLGAELVSDDVDDGFADRWPMPFPPNPRANVAGIPLGPPPPPPPCSTPMLPGQWPPMWPWMMRFPNVPMHAPSYPPPGSAMVPPFPMMAPGGGSSAPSFGSPPNGPATKRVKKEDEIKMKAEMKDVMKKEMKQEVKVEKEVAVKIVIGDGADEWQEVGKKAVPVIEVDDDDWDEDATDAHLETFPEHSPPRPLPKLTPAHKCVEKKVYLYSLGWQGLGMQYLKNNRSALPSLWRQFEFNFKSKRCPDVFVDCRAFHWPRGPKGHTGLHRVAVQQVSDNPLFFTWLQKFHATVATWDFQRPLTAGMICRAGINRSVSGTAILAAILDHAGYTVVVEHLAEASWRQRGICPGTCSYCSDSSLQRTEAYKYGSYCWDSMQH